MTKKELRYWESANEQALFVYDTVFSSLKNTMSETEAHNMAYAAYDGIIVLKQEQWTLYQTEQAEKRRIKANDKELKRRLQQRQENSRPLIARFANWLFAEKRVAA